MVKSAISVNNATGKITIVEKGKTMIRVQWDLVLIGVAVIFGLILEARKRRADKREIERQRRRANMFMRGRPV